MPPLAKAPRRGGEEEEGLQHSQDSDFCMESQPAPAVRYGAGCAVRYESLQEMLAVLRQQEVRERVVRVPGDHCCWLWAAGICSGELAVDAFVETPYPRARLTPTARRLVQWMHDRRGEVSQWLEGRDGAAAMEQVPDNTITDIYGCVDIDGCAQRSAVPAQVLLETEWGRSLYLHGLAQVARATRTSKCGGYFP